MTEKKSDGINRRPLLIGTLGVLGLAAVAGIGYEVPRTLRLEPRGPYDDILKGLDATDAATTLGRTAVADAATFVPGKAAEALSRRIGRGTLEDAVVADARAGDLREVKGWVLPTSLVLACSLATIDG